MFQDTVLSFILTGLKKKIRGGGRKTLKKITFIKKVGQWEYVIKYRIVMKKTYPLYYGFIFYMQRFSIFCGGKGYRNNILKK